MEFPFRAANLITLAHATEDEQKVLMALRVLLPRKLRLVRENLKAIMVIPFSHLQHQLNSGNLCESFGCA